jgi:hypothetical protein
MMKKAWLEDSLRIAKAFNTPVEALLKQVEMKMANQIVLLI